MRLFIIENGFDIVHSLPTRFDSDFKTIASKNEMYNFWDIYQNQNNNIWADFENSLAHPNFNSLEKILNGYEPDYDSDKEAEEYAASVDRKVVLIDGQKLASLMIEHNVGISTVRTFEIKRIDSDYFEE